ncbi:MAG: UDP-glucose/GDP-mannose dehydrogenase family protein [Candidatus Korobacteraceae bacterium]|jgi:UDPglucose 6-dehydrogenase
MLRVAVVGSGYVGLVSAVCFAELDHRVMSVDNDSTKLESLRSGEVPIHEKLLRELLQRHLGKNVTFSGDIEDAVRWADVVFITVGTPSTKLGEADLSYVEAVVRRIAAAIDGDKKLIVEKSTVPVRTCEQLRRSLQLYGCAPELFSVASNPEFLREGSAVMDFLCPDRIVIGVDDEYSEALLREIYRPLTDGSYYKRVATPSANIQAPPRLLVTSAKSAELIKHASNAFLAMKISFINAVAEVTEAVGADIGQICEGIGSDARIGSKFLNPGIGYGGSCFPKDVNAFKAVAKSVGYEFGLLTEVMLINEEQRVRFIQKIRRALWTLRGKRIATLGLAFKGGTDDIRESPAIDIIERLIAEGVNVVAFDPAAMDRAREYFAGATGVSFVDSPYQAIDNADALVILTEWQEFAELDLVRVKRLLKLPIVIDGRNLYAIEAMQKARLIYHSIGRRAIGET